MVKSIEKVYSEFKAKFPASVRKNFYLASGGLSELKGPSDVDIVFMVEDYMNLDHLFPNYKKEPREDKKRCYYSTKLSGREVSICASNDKAALRSVKHRENELMLNTFPLITACATFLKLDGMKTEPAWAKVLGLEGDAYDAMTMPKSKLKKIAKEKEDKLKKLYAGFAVKA